MAFKRDIIAAGIITTTYPNGDVERRIQASSVPQAQMVFWGHPNEKIVFSMYDLPQSVRSKRDAVDIMLDMSEFDKGEKAWLKRVAAGEVPMQLPRGEGKSRRHLPAVRSQSQKPLPRKTARVMVRKRATEAPSPPGVVPSAAALKEIANQAQARADEAARAAEMATARGKRGSRGKTVAQRRKAAA